MRGRVRSGDIWLMLDSDICPAVGAVPTVLWRSLSAGISSFACTRSDGICYHATCLIAWKAIFLCHYVLIYSSCVSISQA